MPKKRLLSLKPFLILLSVAVFWILVPIVFKSSIRSVFYEFQAPLSTGASYVRELQNYWAARTKSKNELYDAGKDLARLNATYELMILENQTLKQEVERLEELLQLPTRPDYRYEIARVVSRDFNSWWQHLEIRKGGKHGIPTGAPVVFSGGVVGRVIEVHEYTSTVELLSNSHLRMAVIIAGDNRPMSYRGSGFQTLQNPVGIAEYIPNDINIDDPSNPPRIITSGMGGVFPAGLPIGYLRRLRPGASGMFQDGDVYLDKRLARLTEVAVLIAVEGNYQ
ncbi:MAG: rod shape-determining protein MreC [Opitutales bacterium]|nr:rod shape-determining protein MreC [Opitutales bacterium]MBT5814720.1 rod shape-determining protein MreC [Opitutales bacterium]